MKQSRHKIKEIQEGSIAQELELEAGDELISINGQPVEDVFDYHYLVNDEYIELLVKKQSGEEWELEVEKDYDEDLGIVFENSLMDEYRSCRNKCVFCFIDQMPPGMRETLYFKDDDSRLSFLQGNYVTLTNMSDHDIERIIHYHLAPINISFQTTNPQLRCKMLHNRFAGDALKKVDQLYEAGITMNGQIVLCKGVNDGEELEYSIQKMSEYAPVLQSVSVVPVGLTKFRDGLYPLKPFEKEDAKEVLEIIHKWQKICYEKHGIHFVQASDEWYLLAEEPFPPEENYDGYIQLENGVGMIPLLESEFDECLAYELEEQTDGSDQDMDLEEADNFETIKMKQESLKEPDLGETDDTGSNKEQSLDESEAGNTNYCRTVSVATGKSAAGLLHRLADKFMKQHPDIKVIVYQIRNDFFGEMITVSGLLTGQDLKAQLSGQELGDMLLLPCNLLRSGEEVFLDDMTLTELENALQVPIHIVKSDGQCLYDSMLGQI